MTALSMLAFAFAQTINPADYPELATERLLPIIITDLKTYLVDPHSVRDLTICPPTNIRIKDGKPYSWTVSFALNSRNAVGGYTGFTSYDIDFENGRIVLHTFPTALPGPEGRILMRVFEKCNAVPDAVVQDLLAKPVFPGN